MPARFADRWLPVAGVTALVVLAALVFGFWPGLDLWITAQFYDGVGFPAEMSATSQALRLLVWDLSIAMAVLSLVMVVIGLATRRPRLVPAHIWAFIGGVYLLGPGLLVNGVLKEHWGRARPATTTDFGGTWDFTPFWQRGRQCLANCSFTSGEAASAMALAIALFALMPFVMRGRSRGARICYGAIAVLLPVAGAVQRLLAGRHFASDVIFSALFVSLIAAILRAVWLGRTSDPG